MTPFDKDEYNRMRNELVTVVCELQTQQEAARRLCGKLMRVLMLDQPTFIDMTDTLAAKHQAKDIDVADIQRTL